MILSLIIILISGFIIGLLFEKIKLPSVVGMIFIGVLLGPSLLNIIDDSLMEISNILRQIALVIILTRSGLSLDINVLKKIGRPAIFMSFIPATLEIISVLIFGPMLLQLSVIESLLLGTVLAAVSPAIIVPRMIKLIKTEYGKDNNVPELIMAGSSVDDIYVIILFYSFLGLAKGAQINAWTISQIPISIILGALLGFLFALFIKMVFKQIKNNTTVKVLVLLGISLLLIGFELILKPFISVSALIAIIIIGVMILFNNKEEARKIEKVYKKLWFFFEIILFVLVGISVDIKYFINAGFIPLIIIIIALLFRIFGVYLSLLFTNLNKNEKLFVIISYIPKATVQASIGAIALTMGLSVGPLILTVAVLSIVITAPLGALLIDKTYKKLLLPTNNK